MVGAQDFARMARVAAELRELRRQRPRITLKVIANAANMLLAADYVEAVGSPVSLPTHRGDSLRFPRMNEGRPLSSLEPLS